MFALLLTLPDELAATLQRKANQWNLPLDELVIHLIREALAREERPDQDEAESDAPSVEEVVARIRATPPDPAAFHPPRKSLQEVLADLAQNPPAPSDISPEEWDRMWAAFEQNLKALDRADDIAEGRL